MIAIELFCATRLLDNFPGNSPRSFSNTEENKERTRDLILHLGNVPVEMLPG
jgi:hypothetical protein